MLIIFAIYFTLIPTSLQIIDPDERQYNSAIKTTDHQKLQIHHNYSRVHHHNPHINHSIVDEDRDVDHYPVYNAHTYSVRPLTPTQQQQLQRPHAQRLVDQNQNPTKTIIFQRRKKETPKIQIYSKCPSDETGQFVYELSCNQFLNCWKGRGYVQNCAPGTLFNPKTLECDYISKVECVTGPRQNILTNNNQQRYGRQVDQVNCPNGFNGIIPNYNDCSKFINCVNGQQYSLDCPPGTLFDIDKNICDFEHKAHCFNGQNRRKCDEDWCQINGFRQIHTETQQYRRPCDDEDDHQNPYHSTKCGTNGTKPSTSTQHHGTDNRQVKCPEGAVGIHKHPTDCSKFLNCANGITYVQECGIGTLFNPSISVCDYPEHVDCDSNKSETTIPNSRWNNEGSTLPNYPNTPWYQQWNHNTSRPGNYGSSTLPNYPNNPWYQQWNHNTSRPGNYGTSTLPNYPNNPWYQQWNRNISRPENYGGSTLPNYPNNPWYQQWNRNISRPGHYGGSTTIYHQNTYINGTNPPPHQYQGYPDQTIVRPVYYPNYPQPVAPINQNFYHPSTNYPRYPVDQNLDQSLQNPYYPPNQGYGPNLDHNRRHPSSTNWYQPGNEPATTPRLDVININEFIKSTTKIPPRKTQIKPPTYRAPSGTSDYDDYSSGTSRIQLTTTRIERSWPPPFPSTDINADYVFEYEDLDNNPNGINSGTNFGSNGNDGEEEVTLEAENFNEIDKKTCDKRDFHCTEYHCIRRTSVCDNFKDCTDGKDEIDCIEQLNQFSWHENAKLAVLEKERWNNVTIATCAYLCLNSSKFRCKSFNYRKIDRTCFLTNTNIGLTGALISYYPTDYYELIRDKIHCYGTDKFKCNNNKCIERQQICNGHDDCGDRMDEKGCKKEQFGYQIRLTGSKNHHEGNIEITAFGRVGYICDDKFSIIDANVVCKELGFHLGAAEIKTNSYYPTNPRNVTFYMMDDITCNGNESSLIDCDFSGWGVHNCLSQEVAGVVCKTPTERCPHDYWQCDSKNECLPIAFVCDGLLDCTDGSDEYPEYCDAKTELRLVNGSNPKEGRLEIKHHGTWGTVCDDDFNEDAAKVVCRNLGYNGSVVVKKEAYFGQGQGPIWLDQVFCKGNETTIEQCTHWDWGEHNCEHSEDVGVICSNIHERHSAIRVVPSNEQVEDLFPVPCGYRKDNLFDVDDNVHARVVKGSVARKGDYPWQAAIRVRGKTTKQVAHWCGAIIITERYLLTAAHCLIGYSKNAYIIVAGDYDVDEDEGTEQEAYIEDFYIHEEFRKGHKMNNDIALIKLKNRGFKLNRDIQPICLPNKLANYENDGLNCTISGFGSTKSGKAGYSHQLRSGWVPIQKREICTMPHVYGDALTDGMICAGLLEEGVDACDGDSGGPLACLDSGVFTLYGITSWGQHCGYANKPGVYVKVAYYRDWIDNVLRNHSSANNNDNNNNI